MALDGTSHVRAGGRWGRPCALVLVLWCASACGDDVSYFGVSAATAGPDAALDGLAAPDSVPPDSGALADSSLSDSSLPDSAFADGALADGALADGASAADADPRASADIASGVPSCPSLPACTCVGAPDGAACSDGNPCTLGERCLGGACAGAAAVDCSAAPTCTTGQCDPTTGGCAFAAVADQTPCSDGSACTQQDRCKAGQCQGQPALCDDGNPCTDDGCTPQSGCTLAPVVALCDDGNVCTASSTCVGGACSGTATLDCADADPCTTDACDPLGGCIHPVAQDGSPCGASGMLCQAGQCVQSCKLFEGSPGGNASDSFEAVSATPDGYVAVGSTSSKGAGGSDGWIVRWTQANQPLFDVAVGTPAAEGLMAVGIADGPFYAAGWRETAAGTAGWLLGFDKTGAPVWHVTLGEGEQARFEGLAVRAGGFVVVGQHKPKGGTAMAQGLVVACDKLGAVLWQQSIGFQSNDMLSAIRVLGNGDLLVAGLSYTAGPQGDGDAWLARLDKDGNLLWSKQFGTAKYEVARALMASGEFAYLAGSSNAAGGTSYDGFLAAVDGSGAVQWQQTLGGSKDDRFYGVAAIPVGGSMMYVGESEPPGAIDVQGWIVRVDNSGKLAWSKTFGGPLKDRFSAVTTLLDGGVVVVGSRGVKNGKGEPDQNGWVVRLDSAAGTSCQ
jgi:hypothetical protein